MYENENNGDALHERIQEIRENLQSLTGELEHLHREGERDLIDKQVLPTFKDRSKEMRQMLMELGRADLAIQFELVTQIFLNSIAEEKK